MCDGKGVDGVPTKMQSNATKVRRRVRKLDDTAFSELTMFSSFFTRKQHKWSLEVCEISVMWLRDKKFKVESHRRINSMQIFGH